MFRLSLIAIVLSVLAVLGDNRVMGPEDDPIIGKRTVSSPSMFFSNPVLEVPNQGSHTMDMQNPIPHLHTLVTCTNAVLGAYSKIKGLSYEEIDLNKENTVDVTIPVYIGVSSFIPGGLLTKYIGSRIANVLIGHVKDKIEETTSEKGIVAPLIFKGKIVFTGNAFGIQLASLAHKSIPGQYFAHLAVKGKDKETARLKWMVRAEVSWSEWMKGDRSVSTQIVKILSDFITEKPMVVFQQVKEIILMDIKSKNPNIGKAIELGDAALSAVSDQCKVYWNGEGRRMFDQLSNSAKEAGDKFSKLAIEIAKSDKNNRKK